MLRLFVFGRSCFYDSLLLLYPQISALSKGLSVKSALDTLVFPNVLFSSYNCVRIFNLQYRLYSITIKVHGAGVRRDLGNVEGAYKEILHRLLGL